MFIIHLSNFVYERYIKEVTERFSKNQSIEYTYFEFKNVIQPTILNRLFSQFERDSIVYTVVLKSQLCFFLSNQQSTIQFYLKLKFQKPYKSTIFSAQLVVSVLPPLIHILIIVDSKKKWRTSL